MTAFDDPDTLHEFVEEAMAILASVDDALVALELSPRDPERLKLVFRGFHNLKGTCGWMSFAKLEALTSAAEQLVDTIRSGDDAFNRVQLRAMFDAVDTSRAWVRSIEKHGCEPSDDVSGMIARLKEHVADKTRGAALEPISSATPERASTDAVAPVTPARTADVAPPPPAQDLLDEAGSRQGETSDTEDANRSRSVRVDVALLDHLMNQIGELVLVRNQAAQFAEDANSRAMKQFHQRLDAVTVALQDCIMRTRMQPVSRLWQQYPRMVRDLSLELGKQVDLRMQGGETELDRTLIEAIQDPLMHLLRNAIDHGIESPQERVACGKSATGTISLQAYHEGGHVNIAVSDDGRGIDIQALRTKAVTDGVIADKQLDTMSDADIVELIFLPQFSTAGTVTGLSGRGVGLDVVRENLEDIGGSVTVFNRPGCGLDFTVRIPLTLAIIPALLVCADRVRYAIPQVNLVEIIWLASTARIEYVYNAPTYRLRGERLPLAFLRDLLSLDASTHTPSADGELYIAVLATGDYRFGLVVDDVLDTNEIVVKPLGLELRGLDCYAGATVLGDGTVALILDASGLARQARVGLTPHSQTTTAQQELVQDKHAMLLFQAGHSRFAVHLADVSRLEQFTATRIERVGEREYLQYRSAILPLVRVDHLVRERRTRPRTSVPPITTETDSIQVIVHEHDERYVGLVVDEILDIVDSTLDTRTQGTRDGVAGTAIIRGKITELLDLKRARHVAQTHVSTTNT